MRIMNYIDLKNVYETINQIDEVNKINDFINKQTKYKNDLENENILYGAKIQKHPTSAEHINHFTYWLKKNIEYIQECNIKIKIAQERKEKLTQCK